MFTTREKKKVEEKVTLKDSQKIMTDYSTANTQLIKLNAEMEEEVAKVRKKYETKLLVIESQKKLAFQKLEMFAKDKKSELFAKKKTFNMASGAIGFRKGTPKLEYVEGFTIEMITKNLKKYLPNYVRIVEEPAKDKLIADRDNKTINKYFAKVGIEVKQEETFFVKA
jgi:phage host-nuclease inhibitor protein Gam